MEQWKEYRLGEICESVSESYRGKAEKVVLINTSDVLEGECLNHSKVPNKELKGQFKKTFKENDILYSEIRPVNRRYAYIDFFAKDYIASTKLMVLRHNEKVLPKYLYYILQSKDMIEELQMLAEARSGTFPQITFDVLSKECVMIPNINTQEKILAILTSLDNKIQLNRKINSNLEEQAKALFKSWFIDFEPFKGGKFVDSELGMIPEGWEVLSLDEIADYLNGLAMQKFRPTAGEDHLPVLKIKELGQGYCDESCDICSSNVPSQYIVNDSDIIFSWSGTLKVDIWCGGRCGLNQHLFKVTSKEYPKWFYLMWTLEHLNRFIHIAKDKAVTMGHIKREELHKAKVVVPSTPIFNKANMIFAPILNEMINTRTSNRKLIAVRDTLLPKLMSGEIDVEHSKLLFI